MCHYDLKNSNDLENRKLEKKLILLRKIMNRNSFEA